MIHLMPNDKPQPISHCGVLDGSHVWPYVRKCQREVVGKLLDQDVQLLDVEFAIRSPYVCQFHADNMARWLEESSAPNTST